MSSANSTSVWVSLTPGDWVNIVTGLVTFLLVIAAFRSIWQVNVNLKKERRERFLEEIKDWSLEIMKIGGNIDGTPMIDSLQMLNFEGTNISESEKNDAMIKSIKRRLNALAAEASSFVIRLNKLDDEKINEAFNETVSLLKQFDMLLSSWLERKLDNLDEVSRLKRKLDSAAVKLVDKTVRLIDF